MAAKKVKPKSWKVFAVMWRNKLVWVHRWERDETDLQHGESVVPATLTLTPKRKKA